MIQRYGNLIREADQGHFDVIIHGCNCQNTMGAGIALTIKNRWPEVYERDTIVYDAGQAILGNIAQEVVKTQSGHDLIVVNCYTQFQPGGIRPADYEAIAKVFEKLNGQYAGMHVGIPLIGCGLAGGNWKIVETMASEIMKNLKVTVILFPEDNYMQKVAIHGKITQDKLAEVSDDEADWHAGGNVYYEYEGETFTSTRVGLLPNLDKA